MSPSSNSYDVIVFGATGFTGRLAARRLGEEPHLKLAIAGRNRAKLEEIAASCKHKPAIIVSDAKDKDSVFAMVRQGRVIANFAGPFALYGENVIAACAEYGQSYCDITGESPFIRSMIDRYQVKAVESGACLIPMSGFDSVPGDLLSYLAMNEAERHGWRLSEMKHYYQVGGGFNGGTLETALNMAESKQTAMMQNDNVLIPNSSWANGAKPDLGPSYEPLIKKWSSLFFMNFVNTAVVRRSLFLRFPDKPAIGKISYQERMLVPKGPGGKAKAYAITAALAGVAAMTSNPIGRMVLRKLGPSAGEGPSEKAIREGFYRGTLIGREEGRPRVMIKMKAKGDPGNEFTVLAAATTALLLAEGKALMTGFVTPSTGLGDALVQALEAKGVSFSTEYF
jgi:short subunit dehydrogenase-like uncharacterized protein